MPARPKVLSLGDRVRYAGREHTVAALHGTSVRLVDDAQAASVVLLGHLLASEGFAVLGTSLSRPPLPEAGVLEGLPEEAVVRAEWWRRHLTELLTGHPDGDAAATRRAEYDPVVHSLRQRELTKVGELRAAGEEVGLSTLRRMRSRFEREGVAGLVDGRMRRPATGTGRADPRVVDAIARVAGSRTDEPTVSAQVLRRQVERLLVAEHGAGSVRMPSRAAFYRLLEAVTAGQHLFGSARTRRSLGKQPKRMFGQLTAARPGEVMEIDSSPLDVMVIHDDGTVDRCEVTGLVDLATRTLSAVVLRPSTKAVDAALLLARAMTPEPVRPGWSDALRMSRSVLPYASLLSLDERLDKAAAVPVIVPETVVCDHGKAFISDNFRNACRHLGISFQPAHPDTPTDRPHIERTLGSVSTMFAQYVAGYTGRSIEMRGKDPAAQAAWSIHELQELLQEWIVVWQSRPHDGLRDPLMPDRPLSPNEKYAALVSAAGYVPVSLSPEEYIQLMPREWRVIGRSGVRINNRTYDAPALTPFRRQPSGAGPDGKRWAVHYDPYDISCVWIRNHHTGWITATWRHLRTTPVPMGELVFDRAHQILRERGQRKPDEEAVAEVAQALLDRAGDGPDLGSGRRPAGKGRPAQRRDRKVAARTRATSEPAWPRPAPEPQPGPESVSMDEEDGGEVADVVPLEIFDARKEAEKWW
ncbi:Mu transposase C-terminal domain-containing protein [Streptomyces europaeiscabiei]|uniref:Mu transposase C-terminal domain-containing protein n=1 Tax=Streptomyces europaeiscabiei TaxID=146819 RepID=A0ABU4NG92_9ACTN|nr:Mu transposase C-terminal domain-containing protein [Streptomyces europaeiscabiei]MDX3544698.1 Mu transposase C-terminal domain-containing protein [Streptomyces europaeiscabiei]MDX3554048.1 Mu transposase C-terminal domain-containing protein [Streptomyces europaeiscabiei]MDX3702166.1 Mu transposase C-terminal domain-containing protein [Streptomyces europaeiscabiei]MDX3834086.1 Mu transposase C-terminal domain-containing protein [Streptomyces europaeiscabiei]